MDQRRAVVAILGRPNVGKSTLFNRFLGQRRAVVDDLPGVTRDRNYAEVAWNRRVFTLVDTGGYVPRADEGLTEAVASQVEIALGEADLVLMVVDATTGPADYDEEMARLIRNSGRPYLLIVNKVDSEQNDSDAAGFYGLAMGEPACVSALNGRFSGNVLDRVITLLPEGEEEVEDELPVPRIAVVGRPNVGKSTFVNWLLGKDRLVVSPIPGTTRDAIDLSMHRNGRDYLLIDTAGLRRRARAKEQVEFYSSLRTAQSMERCDVAIVLIDAVEGCTLQDVKILERAVELGKGAVLGVNKWDLIEKDDRTTATTTRNIHDRFPSLRNYPIVFISALTGQRAWRTVDTALEVYDRRGSRISTTELNGFLKDLNAHSPPHSKGGRIARMSYCVQPRTAPPTILFFTSRPRGVLEHYRRFLERQLREHFDFLGTPVRIIFRQK